MQTAAGCLRAGWYQGVYIGKTSSLYIPLDGMRLGPGASCQGQLQLQLQLDGRQQGTSSRPASCLAQVSGCDMNDTLSFSLCSTFILASISGPSLMPHGDLVFDTLVVFKTRYEFRKYLCYLKVNLTEGLRHS